MAKESPRIFGKGFGVGVLVALGAAGAVAIAARRFLDRKDVREALANEATEQLKAEVEELMNSDVTNLENGEDENDSDGGM